MDIGRTFSQSFAILKKNIAAMLVGGVLVAIAYVVCSLVPAALTGDLDLEATSADTMPTGSSLGASLLGIVLQMLVLTPLAAGLVAIAVSWARTGRTAEVGEAFGGFRRLGALVLFQLILIGAYLLASIVVIAIMFFGGIALAFIPFGFVVLIPLMLAPYVYIVINWLYVVAVLFDKDCGVMEALSESRRQVRRNGFWPTLLVALLVGLAGFAATLVTLGLGSIVVVPWMAAAVVAMYFQASDRSQQLDAVIAGYPPGPATGQAGWMYGTGQGLPPGAGAAPGIGGALPGIGGAPATPRPAPAQSWDQMPGAKSAEAPAGSGGARPATGPDAATAAQNGPPDEPPGPPVEAPTPPTPPDPA